MGLLHEEAYWRDVVNALWRIRPNRTQVLKEAVLVDFLDILCRALSDLCNDVDLREDLRKINQIINNPELPAPDHDEFKPFLTEFTRWETGLLIQSGMDENQAVELINSMRKLSAEIQGDEVEPERLLDLLNFAREMACQRIGETEDTNQQSEALNAVVDVTTGVLVVSANLSVLTVSLADPTLIGVIAAKLFAGKSIEFGVKGIAGALKRYF